MDRKLLAAGTVALAALWIWQNGFSLSRRSSSSSSNSSKSTGSTPAKPTPNEVSNDQTSTARPISTKPMSSSPLTSEKETRDPKGLVVLPQIEKVFLKVEFRPLPVIRGETKKNFEFGAEVIGLNLAKLDDEDCFTLRDALWRYNMLLLRKQDHVTSQDQIKLAQRLNPNSRSDCQAKTIQEIKSTSLEWKIEGSFNKASYPLINYMQCLVESTAGRSMNSVEYDGKRLIFPSGSTLFVSGYTAYDLLTQEQKDKAEKIKVHYSDSNSNKHEKDASGQSSLPLVWCNPVTKRKVLTANTNDIAYLQFDDQTYSKEESRTLLTEFTKPALDPSYVYAHDWKAGDLVIWDNFGMWYSATAGKSKKLRLVSL